MVCGLTLLTAALIPGLVIDASHSAMYDPDAQYVRDYGRFLARYGSPNQLVVMVEGGDEAGRRAVVDAALGRLPSRGEGLCDAGGAANQPGCVAEVAGRIDLDRVGERALLFVPHDVLEAVVTELEDGDFSLASIRGLSSLAGVFTILADRVEDLSESALPEAGDAESGREVMDVASKFFRELALRVRDEARDELSMEQALFRRSGASGIDTEGYLSSDDGAIKLALVRAVVDSDHPDHVVPFVRYVRQQLDAAAAEVSPEVRVTLTGLPAIIHDEAAVLWGDVLRTGVLATAGLFLILMLGFGSLGQTVLALLPLGFTLVWTLAFTRVVYGGLTLITATIVPVLLGLCVDSAVHLLTRFNEARAEDAPAPVVAALLGAGPGMLTGALTTSGAFIALAVSDFPGFQQVGVITGVGLVVGVTMTLTMIPALLSIDRLAVLRGRTRPTFGFLAAVPEAVVRLRVPVVVGCAALAAVSLWTAREIHWSYDYAQLLPQRLESTQGLQRLTTETDFSAEVAALEVDSVEAARTVGEKIAALPTVARVESLANFFPERQVEKLALLERLRPQSESPLGRAGPVDVPELRQAVQDLADALEDAAFDARRAGSEHAALLDPPIAALKAFQAALKETPEGVASARLTRVQTTVFDARDRAMRLVSEHLGAPPMTPGDLLERLPRAMRSRLANPDGHLAVYVYPTDPVGDPVYLTQLVSELRTFAPAVTGFPVTHLASMDAIRKGITECAGLALLLVLLLLLLDFRSPRYALMAAVPLAVGIAWTWGGVSALGLSYNAGNVVTLPLLIGIAVDSGVHILHRYRQEREADVVAVVRHTGRAVTLSGLTTAAGFGALMIAEHASMHQFGLLLVMGAASCLLSACVLLPALLSMRGVNGRGGGPVD